MNKREEERKFAKNMRRAMKQVNMSISDEHYAVLVREAAKRQLVKGKLVKVASLSYELLKPTIVSLNGSKPTEKPTEDNKQVNTSLPNEPTSEDSEQSQLSNDFANIDL